MEQDFLVCNDAYKEGLGEVLMQEGGPFSYASRKHRCHEDNYVTDDLELVLVVYALRLWRHYLVSMIFVLKTNHHGLQYIFT